MNLIYNLIIAFAMYSKLPMPHMIRTRADALCILLFPCDRGSNWCMYGTVDEDGNESNRQ